MKQLLLDHLCPEVFRNNAELDSEIWNREVVLEKGGKYLVEARSGTGKSTLCSYLCGYRNDFSGRLLVDGKNTGCWNVDAWAALRSRNISHLIQDLRLFPELTAYENIDIKNRLTHHRTEAQLTEWLERLGIADKRDVPAGKLSFGQQQRVALLRALAQPYDFLLADEPVSHLDDYHAQQMAQLVLEETAACGAAVIVTSVGKVMDLPYDKTFHL